MKGLFFKTENGEINNSLKNFSTSSQSVKTLPFIQLNFCELIFENLNFEELIKSFNKVNKNNGYTRFCETVNYHNVLPWNCRTDFDRCLINKSLRNEKLEQCSRLGTLQICLKKPIKLTSNMHILVWFCRIFLKISMAFSILTQTKVEKCVLRLMKKYIARLKVDVIIDLKKS